MKKIFAVVRREFVERVRTRAFLISTLLLPVVMVAVFLLPILMSGTSRTSRVAIVDASSAAVGPQVAAMLGAEKLGTRPDAEARYSVQVFPASAERLAAVRDELVAKTGFGRRHQADQWNGVLVLTDATLASGKLVYYGGNVGGLEAMGKLQRTLSQALATWRLGKSGIDQQLVKQATAPADLQTVKVEDGKLAGQSGEQSFVLAYAMGFILYMAVLIYGQQTMTSVVEEKNSRIMEVLASSLTPFQMLLGKVLGVGAAGLAQMAIWGGSAALLSSQRGPLGALFGMNAATLQSLPIPSMSGGVLVVFLLYFLLGFLLYGALYAAIGAMCNSIQETQQYALFVTMFILVGFFAMFSVIRDPNSTLGMAMSLVPFFAPFVMPVRWSMTTVPPLELAASLGLMVVGLLACTWLAGRIYRTGILMYGKKPSWREVWRWIRA
ncbi:MAG TPA: ABC transporter permease [Rhodanobacter sp.]|nr:ABC transporter permease [Rhodanobacter sp.]